MSHEGNTKFLENAYEDALEKGMSETQASKYAQDLLDGKEIDLTNFKEQSHDK